MFSAFSRIIFISVGVIIAFLICILALRNIGGQLEYVPLKHPLLNQESYIIADGGGNEVAPKNSAKSFRHSLSINPEVILEADTRMTRDGIWVLFEPTRLEAKTGLKGAVEFTLAKDLKKAVVTFSNSSTAKTSTKILYLEEFLKEFGKNKLLINILSVKKSDLDGLVKLLDKYVDQERIIINSPSFNVIKQIRKLKPLWLYAADGNTLAKLHLFSSLFLEPMLTMDSDMFIAPMKSKTYASLNKQALSEIKRRKRKAILMIDQQNPEILPNFDGVFTEKPSQFLESK